MSAESLVHANFNGASWSQRLWERQDVLQSIVRKGVQDTVLRGKGTSLLIRELQKEFKASYNQARRLAVTETARVYSEAQKANYKANGVEEYQVLVEVGACRFCSPFDEKHFPVDEMTPGVNAAPFHPHCRCTTAPYSDRAKMWDDKHYESVKDERLSNADPSKGKVTDMDFWVHKGVRLPLKDKEVELSYSQRELDVATWLSSTMGWHFQMAPRVNNPIGVKTPDYLVDGLRLI